MTNKLNKFFALTLLASLSVISTQAAADGSSFATYVSEQNTINGQTVNMVLPIQSGSQNYFAGSASIKVGTTSSNGTSFLAYCIDPFQWASSTPTTYTQSSLSSLGSSHATDVSKLYSQAYASTVGNNVNSAAFQIALWELAKDDGNLTTGAVRTTSSTNATIVAAANSMISNAKTGVAGSTNYSFNLYASDTKQDYLVASVSSVSPVPEPNTYALMIAGLGLISFTAGRRRASK